MCGALTLGACTNISRYGSRSRSRSSSTYKFTSLYPSEIEPEHRGLECGGSTLLVQYQVRETKSRTCELFLFPGSYDARSAGRGILDIPDAPNSQVAIATKSSPDRKATDKNTTSSSDFISIHIFIFVFSLELYSFVVDLV